MISELRQTYPVSRQESLERKCSEVLPAEEEGDGGGPFTNFITFITKYFAFIRDVDVSDLLETHQKLKLLLGCAGNSTILPSELRSNLDKLALCSVRRLG